MKPYDNQKALELSQEERLEQWAEVEGLVLTYQKYLHDPTEQYISEEAVAGSDIVLTIDANLQKIAETDRKFVSFEVLCLL